MYTLHLFCVETESFTSTAAGLIFFFFLLLFYSGNQNMQSAVGTFRGKRGKGNNTERNADANGGYGSDAGTDGHSAG